MVTPIRLYHLYCTLYCCTLTLTLTRRQPSALVALSFAFASDCVWLCFQILQCTQHRLQLSQHFSLAISLRNHQLFPKFSLSVGSKQRATNTLDFWTRYSLLIFFVVVLRRFPPQADGPPSTHILYQVILTLFATLFFCVRHIPFWFLFCSKLATPSSISPFFCLQWLLIPILLGTSAHQTFGLGHFFRTCKHDRDNLTSPVAAAATAQVKLVPTMRRNLTFGSASSRTSFQQRGSNHKSSNTPMLLPACQRLQPPRHSTVGALLLAAGREATKGPVTPAPKVAPLLPRLLFVSKPWQWCVNFTIITPIRLTGALRPLLGQKTSLPPDHFRFNSQSNTRHCHGNTFPRQCWIDFSHRLIDKWQVFGGYWSNTEHCSLQPKFQPIWPPSQRGRWATYPLLGFNSNNCAIPRQAFYKPLWPVPFWALTFWENSRPLFLQKSAKYNLLALQRPRPPPQMPSAAPPSHPMFSAASSASLFFI